MVYNPEKHHRRSIRLQGHDYSQPGHYFITICTQNQECLFGKIENSKMILNKYGKIAKNEWLKSFKIRQELNLDCYIIMPNHIHGIIIISKNEFVVRANVSLPSLAFNKNHYGTGRMDNKKQANCHSPLHTRQKNKYAKYKRIIE